MELGAEASWRWRAGGTTQPSVVGGLGFKEEVSGAGRSPIMGGHECQVKELGLFFVGGCVLVNQV